MPTGARLARTDDVDDMARINVLVWRQRLSPVVGANNLDFLQDTDFATLWGDAILRPPSPLHRVAVAVDDGDRVCGYAAWGPSADADSSPGDVEVFAFEVDPQFRRIGHGSRLMSAVVDMSANLGAHALSMWCDIDDEGRRAFLSTSGWAPDTAWRDIEVSAGCLVREVRLVTGLV
jgi:ribosomal protein S18 acetylase RimI-like enzyme